MTSLARTLALSPPSRSRLSFSSARWTRAGLRADDTQVVLGKFLSPKLFVSYGISIVEAINTIKLRYTLNERWSLKAEAGLDWWFEMRKGIDESLREFF